MNKLILIVLSIALATSKLYQVVSLSRHGARYHVDPAGGGQETKPLWGQLTAVGMKQHQKLGQLLRKEYIQNLGFLSPTYNASQIEVYSTPLNRTIESIQAQLFGLYPPGSGPRLGWAERKWHLPPYSNTTNIQQNNFAFPYGAQPIQVKLNQKIMLNDCPNYDQFAVRNLQMMDDVFQEMKVTYQPFMKKMSTLFNYTLPQNPIYGMLRIYDAVNVDKHLGRPLPQGFTNDDFLNLRHLANWYYSATITNNNTLMINSEKISRIYSLFQTRQRIPSTYSLKWSFLSGHDTDIIAMYIGLNITSASCIEQMYRTGTTSALECQDGGNQFASNIIFELHSDDAKNFFVKVRVNGNYINVCGKKQTQCEYTLFKLYTKWNLTNNLEDICGKKIEGSLKGQNIEEETIMVEK